MDATNDDARTTGENTSTESLPRNRSKQSGPQSDVGRETREVVDRGESAVESAASDVVAWEATALATGVAVGVGIGVGVAGVVGVMAGEKKAVDVALGAALAAVAWGGIVAARRWAPKKSVRRGLGGLGGNLGKRGAGRVDVSSAGGVGDGNSGAAAIVGRACEDAVDESHAVARRVILTALDSTESEENREFDRNITTRDLSVRNEHSDSSDSDDSGGVVDPGGHTRSSSGLSDTGSSSGDRERDEQLRQLVRDRLPEFGRSGVLPKWHGDDSSNAGDGAQTPVESVQNGVVRRAANVARRGLIAARQLARRLVRRVVNRVQEEINIEEDLGWKGKRWVSERDDRVRASHEYLDGKKVALGASFQTQNGPIRYPGDPLAHLSETINCRCYLELLQS